jgi:hypothetical protein
MVPVIKEIKERGMNSALVNGINFLKWAPRVTAKQGQTRRTAIIILWYNGG